MQIMSMFHNFLSYLLFAAVAAKSLQLLLRSFSRVRLCVTP